MNFSWYINRLRSMEPAELVHRLGEKARKLRSKRRHQGWDGFSGASTSPLLPHFAQQVRAASPVQQAAIAQASEALLGGQYAALGQVWPAVDAGNLFPAERWRLDPVTGQLWPGAERYCFEIDFRHDGTRGDIKYVWEFNRLQFLPVLAAQWLLSGDAANLRAIEQAIGSWHAANPPFGGVAWASGIEVALRGISLVLALELVGPHLSEQTQALMGQILSASLFWLKRYPSRFSSANNHLVAELVGEYVIGAAIGHRDEKAWADVLEELGKQILPDGGGAEQTPSYGAFTAELVLMAALVARQGGRLLLQASSERLAAFHQFLLWTGPQARFGDDDEGRVVALGFESDYGASVGAAIAVFLRLPSPFSGDDFRALLFGQQPGSATPPRGLKVFPQTGLSVWRGELGSRPAVLRFDHGPLGYLGIAAHGHADALSISLELDGQAILVDPGTFLYGSGGPWRDWFRSTPAHNTLNLGGQSQSIISGAFNWSHKAQSHLLEHKNDPHWELLAEHDGYERRFGVRHRRRLRQEGSAILIEDQLTGRGHDAEIVFQLAPGLQADLVGTSIAVSRDGSALLSIGLPPGSIQIASGGAHPGEGGWVSPRFGRKVAAPRISWRGRVDAAGVTTVLSPLSH